MARLIELKAGYWRLEGALNLATVAALGRAAPPLSADQGVVDLDLSGVDQAASVGVALLLEWRQRARRAGYRLRVRHWPESLVRIADLSNLDGLLGLREETAAGALPAEAGMPAERAQATRTGADG